jgi:hypothetical protein
MTTINPTTIAPRRTLAAIAAIAGTVAVLVAVALFALAAGDGGSARAGGSPGGVLRAGGSPGGVLHAGGAPGGVLRSAPASSFAHGIYGGRLQTRFRMHAGSGDGLNESAAS